MRYQELIQYFATNKISQIRNLPDFQKYCEKNLGDFGFENALDETEKAKKNIEERLDGLPGPKDQIRLALKLLGSLPPRDFERYHELIAAGYKPRWSQDQQKYFEHFVPVVRSGNYFFLSFTSRPTEDGPADKRVNRRYWHFIRRTIRQSSGRDRKTRNLLADTLDTLFHDDDLSGFYYKRHDSDNAVVRTKLLQACRSSLVFVQLVDNAMFDHDSSREENWCAFEYDKSLEYFREIANLVDNRIVFIVTEKDRDQLRDPYDVHPLYRDWVERIRQKGAIYLIPCEDYDKGIIDETKRVIAAMVKEVKAVKQLMLEHVPD